MQEKSRNIWVERQERNDIFGGWEMWGDRTPGSCVKWILLRPLEGPLSQFCSTTEDEDAHLSCGFKSQHNQVWQVHFAAGRFWRPHPPLLLCTSVSSLQSKMTERVPWWKAFLPKRKSGGPKDANTTHTFEPDFDPFAPKPEKQKDPKTTGDQPQQESYNSSSLHSDDTYDDSHLESVFNEQTCRRNMRVSRSGRFKEKRKIRSSLPLQEKETENVASGKEGMRWWWGGGDQRLLYKRMLEEKERDLRAWRCFILLRRTKRSAVCWKHEDDKKHSAFSPILLEWGYIVYEILDILRFLLMDLCQKTTETMIIDMKWIQFVLRDGYQTISPTISHNQSPEEEIQYDCCKHLGTQNVVTVSQCPRVSHRQCHHWTTPKITYND